MRNITVAVHSVRRYLRHHVGKPVRRCDIRDELQLSECTVRSCIDVLTQLDVRLAEEDDGRLFYKRPED